MRKRLKSHRDDSLVANTDIPTLAIKAQARINKRDIEPDPSTPAIKPARTPLDDQVGEIKIRKQNKEVRRIVGVDKKDSYIDIDLDSLNKSALKPSSINLFDKPGELFGA